MTDAPIYPNAELTDDEKRLEWFCRRWQDAITGESASCDFWHVYGIAYGAMMASLARGAGKDYDSFSVLAELAITHDRESRNK